MIVLGVDIGTSSLKLAVYEGGDACGPELSMAAADHPMSRIAEFSESYCVHIHNRGTFGEVRPEDWRTAFENGCRKLSDRLGEVKMIAPSGTTPAVTAIGGDGESLMPPILMLDGRSRAQIDRIIDSVGLDALLDRTGSIPAPGGCSLASMLWIANNRPELYGATRLFGHSNTWFAGWLTGRYAIDPSSDSPMGFLETVDPDGRWVCETLEAFDLSTDLLPTVLPSNTSVGRLRTDLARRLGLRREPEVVIGGNDAVLAAFSTRIGRAGQALDVNGTSEFGLVCLDRCVLGTNYNVGRHVLPGNWLTLYVMNAGGKALQWFHREFCRDLSEAQFYTEYLPEAVASAFAANGTDADSIDYEPFLLGSQYARTAKTAAFRGLTSQATREDMIAAVVRGLYSYQREDLKEIAPSVPLAEPHILTGCAVGPRLIPAKKTMDTGLRLPNRGAILGSRSRDPCPARNTNLQGGDT